MDARQFGESREERLGDYERPPVFLPLVAEPQSEIAQFLSELLRAELIDQLLPEQQLTGLAVLVPLDEPPDNLLQRLAVLGLRPQSIRHGSQARLDAIQDRYRPAVVAFGEGFQKVPPGAFSIEPGLDQSCHQPAPELCGSAVRAACAASRCCSRIAASASAISSGANFGKPRDGAVGVDLSDQRVGIDLVVSLDQAPDERGVGAAMGELGGNVGAGKRRQGCRHGLCIAPVQSGQKRMRALGCDADQPGQLGVQAAASAPSEPDAPAAPDSRPPTGRPAAPLPRAQSHPGRRGSTRRERRRGQRRERSKLPNRKNILS